MRGVTNLSSFRQQFFAVLFSFALIQSSIPANAYASEPAEDLTGASSISQTAGSQTVIDETKAAEGNYSESQEDKVVIESDSTSPENDSPSTGDGNTTGDPSSSQAVIDNGQGGSDGDGTADGQADSEETQDETSQQPGQTQDQSIGEQPSEQESSTPQQVEKIFADEQTGIQVVISTSDENLKAQIEGATLTVKALAEDSSEYASDKAALQSLLSGEPDFLLYEVSLVKDGAKVKLAQSDATTIKLTIPTDAADAKAYRTSDVSTPVSLEAADGATITVKTDKLGRIALVKSVTVASDEAPAEEEIAANTLSLSANSLSATEPLDSLSASLMSASGSSVNAASATANENLAVGTYLVNANIVILGSDNTVLPGLTVYPMSDTFPPTTPQEQQTETLTVDENGDLYLTLSFAGHLPSEIFTVQNLESSDSLQVVSVERNDTQYGPVQDENGNATSEYVYGRITRVTVKLLNRSGSYAFANCQEFNNIGPLTIGDTHVVKKYRTMPIQLCVDLANAKLQYAPSSEDVTTTLTDSATGASVTMTVPSDLASKLQGSTLKATLLEQGNETYEAALSKLLEDVYYTQPDLYMYDLSVVDANGNPVDTSSAKAISVSLPKAMKSPRVYAYADGALTQAANVSTASDGASTTFDASSLGTFLLCEFQNTTVWNSKSFSDEATGVSATIRSPYDTMVGGSLSSTTMNVKKADGDDGSVTYYPEFVGETGGAAQSGEGTTLTLTLPNVAANSSVYLVTEDDSGSKSMQTLAEPASETQNVTVTVIDPGQNVNGVHASFGRLYNGYNSTHASSYASNYTSDSSYILVTTQKYASEPSVVKGLVYNAQEQQGITLDEKSTELEQSEEHASVAKATNAGSYKCWVKPKEGYVWADGTSDAKEYSWSISRAQATILWVKYVSYDYSGALPELNTIKNGLQVSGLVGDDNAYYLINQLSSKMDQMQWVEYSSQSYNTKTFDSSNGFTPGTEYRLANVTQSEIMNRDGTGSGTYNTHYNYSINLDNYMVSTRISLVVGMTPDEQKLLTNSYALTYSGSNQPYVGTRASNKDGYAAYNKYVQTMRLEHDKTTNPKWPGSYSATLTPRTPTVTGAANELICWSDGSTSSKTVSWTIDAVTLTAKVADSSTTLTEAYDPDKGADLDVAVSGWVGMDATMYNFALMGYPEYYPQGFEAPTARVEGEVEPGQVVSVTPKGGAINKGYVYNYEPANVTIKTVVAAEPVANVGLAYNGQEQVGVSEGRGYELKGTYAAIGAGNYTAVATLKDGYVWADGTTGAKDVKWSIAKAPLTAAFVDETVESDAEPVLQIDVTGWANGEDADTAEGYRAPSVKITESGSETAVSASKLEVGKTYDVTLSGGWAKNYVFASYTGGHIAKKAAPRKSDLEAGTYTVTANLYLPGELNPILTGLTAYVTNPNNPFGLGGYEKTTPTDPVSDNATLVVAEDGSMTLTLPVVNPVFTLQKIGVASNATATATGMGEALYAEGTSGDFSTRISELTIELDDTSGTYVFSGSYMYPTINLASAEAKAQLEDVPLTLSVELPGSSSTDDNNKGKTDDNKGTTDNNKGTADDNGKSNTGGKTDDNGNTNTSKSSYKPGTYTVSANVWVAAKDASAAGFPLLSVLAGNDGAAYMTNAMNPMGAGGAAVGVPTTPVSNNATLVVAEDGTMTLTVPVVNPVFTLQNIGSNSDLGTIATHRVSGNFGGADSRIDTITVTLPAGTTDGDWVLSGASFRPAIQAVADRYGTITVPMHLTLGGLSNLPSADGSGKTIENGNGNNAAQNQNNDTNANQGQNGQTTNGSATNGQTAGSTTSGSGMRLTAGTYNVTANIWLSDRSATGLPLMPYLTSSAFPPMYPVTGNATLTVDNSGHAWVRVPIQIQSRIMNVGSISGLNITSVEYGSNGVSAITVDLGVITDFSGRITQGCTVNITMGSLASTISGITGSHSWPATFQVVFTGVPVSGNSTSDIPESLREALASGELTAGEGALAAAGTGEGASDEFLSVAVDAASDAILASEQDSLAPTQGRITSQKGVTASASKALRTLDPNATSGTSATTALAMAAALGGQTSDGSISQGSADVASTGALAAAILGSDTKQAA